MGPFLLEVLPLRSARRAMPNTPTEPTPATRPTLDVRNLLFMTLSPAIAIPGTIWYTYTYGIEWWMPALFLVLYSLVGLSITAGYHRCFSHRSYECAWIVQVFYAIFGAMSFQNSALWWSAGHRRHHRHAQCHLRFFAPSRSRHANPRAIQYQRPSLQYAGARR